MSVGLLIISHGGVGEVLFKTAQHILESIPLPTRVLEVPNACDPDAMVSMAAQCIDELNQGDGVLVLTDMYGSTPSNISCSQGRDDVVVIAGINLPMLIRVMNYPHASLEELADKAMSGGRDGIMVCHTPLTRPVN